MIDIKHNTDWAMLKAVVAALWLTAGLTLLIVYYATPADRDIVLTDKTMPVAAEANAAPVHLVSSAGN